MHGFPDEEETQRRETLCARCPERTIRTVRLMGKAFSYAICGVCGCVAVARIKTTCPKHFW